MALPDLTGLNIQDSYKRVLHTDGTIIYDGTGSIFTPATASHALFAVSASHEITFELSSSHAINSDTASFIANGIHNLTSGEVNQLKDINSHDINNDEWGYVAGGQAHGMEDDPTFNRLNITRNIKHAPEMGAPSEPLIVGSDSWFGIALNGKFDTRPIDFTSNNVSVAFINKEGEYSGQASNIYGAPDISVRKITATGDISSSRYIYGDHYYSNGEGIAHDNGTTTYYGNTKLTEIDGTNIKLDAPVTATGDISASGDLYANSINLPYGESVKWGGEGYITVDGGSGQIMFDSLDVVIGNGLSAQSTTLGNTIDDTHTFIGNITASGHISASGNLIVSESLTFGASSAEIISPTELRIKGSNANDYMVLADNNISLFMNGGQSVEHTPTHFAVNASNQNIDFKVNHDNGVNAIWTDASTNRVKLRDYVSIGSGSVENADPNALLVTGTTHFKGNVTASNNISASGNLIANTLTGTINGGTF